MNLIYDLFQVVLAVSLVCANGATSYAYPGYAVAGYPYPGHAYAGYSGIVNGVAYDHHPYVAAPAEPVEVEEKVVEVAPAYYPHAYAAAPAYYAAAPAPAELWRTGIIRGTFIIKVIILRFWLMVLLECGSGRSGG